MKTHPMTFLAAALFSSPAGATDDLTVNETADRITITRGDTTVLVYHKSEVPPPPGADPVFARSGFIHPLCTPSGEPVTGIHPADHYHHLGLFHAWVKTKHGEDEPDFWNLGSKTGRVRYAATESVAGPDEPARFVVKQEHVAYKGEAREETVVLAEKLTVTAGFIDDRNLVIYEVSQTNVSDTTLELPAYRYGGCLGWRGPHSWDKDNSTLLTSEGKRRDDSHTTRAKWIAYTGPTDAGDATFAVLIHEQNHDFPQRLRTWSSTDHHGAPFLSIVPTQETSWAIEPGETIQMRYTLVTADQPTEADTLESLWERFASADD